MQAWWDISQEHKKNQNMNAIFDYMGVDAYLSKYILRIFQSQD